jgi:hypothetical protein
MYSEQLTEGRMIHEIIGNYLMVGFYLFNFKKNITI